MHSTRPFLFGLDPENAHELTLEAIARLQNTPLQALWAQPRVSDPVTVAGLKFPNRIGLAAGLDKNGRCIDGLGAMGFGFIEVGTVTPKPQPGNPKPRMFRLPQAQALINRLGFNNAGLDAFLANVKRAKRFRRSGGIVGLNIGKNAATPIERAVDDYLACLEGVYPHADYVTVNISSPNTQDLRSLQSDDRARCVAVGAAAAQATAGEAARTQRADVREDCARSRRNAGEGDRADAEASRHRRRDRDQHDARAARGRGHAACRRGGGFERPAGVRREQPRHRTVAQGARPRLSDHRRRRRRRRQERRGEDRCGRGPRADLYRPHLSRSGARERGGVRASRSSAADMRLPGYPRPYQRCTYAHAETTDSGHPACPL